MPAVPSRGGHDRAAAAAAQRHCGKSKHLKRLSSHGTLAPPPDHGSKRAVHPHDPRSQVELSLSTAVETVRSGVLEKPISATDGGDLNFSFLAATRHTGPCGVLSPVSKSVVRWEYITVMLMLFTTTITPFEIAFLKSASVDFLFVINRLVDIGFLIDMYFCFRISYIVKSTQTYETRPSKVRTNYILSWFPLDVVSLIPWDVIAMLNRNSGGNMKVLRMLKLLKLTKMLRVLKSARALKSLQVALGLNSTSSQLCKYIVMVTACLHWVACGWGMMAAFANEESVAGDEGRRLKGSSSADSGGHDGSTISWLVNLEENAGEQSLTGTYALCIEYALSVMCMSYGTIQPVNSGETWFSVSMMIVAGSVYAYVIGGICSALASEDPATAEYKSHIDTLMLLFREVEIDPELKMNCLGYMRFTRNMLEQRSHLHVLDMMPRSLKGQLCVALYGDVVKRISVFQRFFQSPSDGSKSSERMSEAQVELLAGLCSTLEQEAFPPAEMIYFRGDVAGKLYLLTKGVAKQSGGFLATPLLLGVGDSFGIDMLLSGFDWKRVHAVRSLSFTLCSSISAKALSELQHRRPLLFSGVHAAIRLYQNCLRCAYTMQRLGQQVRTEIASEVKRAQQDGVLGRPLMTLRSEARVRVYGKYRAQILERANDKVQSISAASGTDVLECCARACTEVCVAAATEALPLRSLLTLNQALVQAQQWCAAAAVRTEQGTQQTEDGEGDARREEL